jgi:hypothetical protein
MAVVPVPRRKVAVQEVMRHQGSGQFHQFRRLAIITLLIKAVKQYVQGVFHITIALRLDGVICFCRNVLTIAFCTNGICCQPPSDFRLIANTTVG